jgi:2-aminoadipate transaminase
MITSFAGGLPNPDLFPVDELKVCTEAVFNKYGTRALQYTTTEGLLALRELIAQRYKQRFNLEISIEQILITNGSQQALDLIGKLFVDKGDAILMERPGYLGALQCFSMYEADICQIALNSDGLDTEELESKLRYRSPKLLYAIPNFQNPTGLSYSIENRRRVAELLSESGTLLVEDDPYGEISFSEKQMMPLYSYIPDHTILLGSFSKIIAPGLRIGWMIANPEIIRRATILKQASDLHSCNLSQFILAEYMSNYNLDKHIDKIKKAYSSQCEAMLEALHCYFPFSVSYTRPKGGMFCWLRLPEGKNARTLLAEALKQNIIFVPGDTFYAADPDYQTLRLNFSNLGQQTMVKALETLGGLL